MNSHILAHQTNCELEAILKKLAWRGQITQAEIGIKPLKIIQEALSFVKNKANLKNHLMTFEETYILNHLIELSMVELIEQEGIDYINNMVNSLKKIINLYQLISNKT